MNFSTFRCVSESGVGLAPPHDIAAVCIALSIVVFIFTWEYVKWRIFHG